MKMQSVLNAGRDVPVTKPKCKPADSLAVDAVIMEFA
jgi:acetyl/propionyl-CoA carboxylase alpha subunit